MNELLLKRRPHTRGYVPLSKKKHTCRSRIEYFRPWCSHTGVTPLFVERRRKVTCRKKKANAAGPFEFKGVSTKRFSSLLKADTKVTSLIDLWSFARRKHQSSFYCNKSLQKIIVSKVNHVVLSKAENFGKSTIFDIINYRTIFKN